MTTAPPAQGVRRHWDSVPEPVRRALAEALGAPVVRARTQSGGFSPGVAARVTLADGRRAFVKAVSAQANPHTPKFHRAEARNAAALPESVPAPRLLTTYDDGTWVALAFEDVAGRQPHVPWRAAELTRVLDAVARLGRTPAPPGTRPAVDRLAENFAGWRRIVDEGRGPGAGLDAWSVRNAPRLAELASSWTDFADGDMLAHADLRADNILLTADDVVFVDWPHAVRAAPWFDLLVMLPCVRAQGGPQPERVFSAHPLGRAAEPEGVTRALAGLAGYFLEQAGRPAPPGLPTLRAFQRAQGEAAVAWLRARLEGG
ncbi:aminoglycoside phosphotransferase family protein [Streptomyces beihaiensis]|uniref:Aminoglycoside phosphotransferase family protein n=1 Tax=Streptomyces beihaiensis TaxID=2984495 RepID=A0ABT3TTK4_9ACTN|nr:phosphotransferase [Streptomyces beihaiensis]MCX3059772.1 aminoglycoside phosphotransferase family protein [Streptomyces beihaiensis]